MSTEIRVPSLGESLNTAILARWNAGAGDYVHAGEVVLELETDKVSLDVPAPVSGKLGDLVTTGSEVGVGAVLAVIDENAPAPPVSKAPARRGLLKEAVPEGKKTENKKPESNSGNRVQKKTEPAPMPLQARAEPQAVMEEGGIRREKMNRLRQTIARNLKHAQNTAAILTTFNEIDMGEVKELRAAYKEEFEKRHHGVRLGFMSFFARAVIESLQEFPALNARIEGDEILYRDHVNLGIAVGTERGLVVPVLRHADRMNFAELEQRISDYGQRARKGAVQLEELSGGSFTITNGGIFGSLLSTPILNAPQTGVLGMHAIQERPVARHGQVLIRPMMYVALSYDHRLVDGREAVSFLVRVKEMLEDPRRLLLGL